ncbi:serine hydrolase domain-containing protein [Leucobacter sp. HNU]|uniref:serine hydrolase domain-containing protein n=1 Tax=Leucobacter sp. HNU TaxID=3236805 RepID=UPI003A803942
MRRQRAWIAVHGNTVVGQEFHPPYTPDALVEWGSVTKPLVAATVAELVRSARLSYETPASEYVQCSGLHPTATIGDLARHRSGLPRVHPGMKSGIFSDPFSGLDGPGFERELARLPLPPRIPGTEEYSNLGYALLGIIIERCTGSHWFEQARLHVLGPAGAGTATLHPGPGDTRALLNGWGRGRREPWKIADGPYSAAGGTWSTLEDLLRFTVHATHPTPEDPTVVGWQVLGERLWHNGQTRDSGACVVTDPRTRLTVIAHTSGHLMGSADRLAQHTMDRYEETIDA